MMTFLTIALWALGGSLVLVICASILASGYVTIRKQLRQFKQAE